jgi:hypothetical protein
MAEPGNVVGIEQASFEESGSGKQPFGQLIQHGAQVKIVLQAVETLSETENRRW